MLSIHKDLCVNCGMCYHLCPEIFARGESSATIRRSELPPELYDLAVDCAADCPVAAIDLPAPKQNLSWHTK